MIRVPIRDLQVARGATGGSSASARADKLPVAPAGRPGSSLRLAIVDSFCVST